MNQKLEAQKTPDKSTVIGDTSVPFPQCETEVLNRKRAMV